MDDFDRLLYQASDRLPPDQLEPPKPWKTPMRRICWGLTLINVTLNFWGLNLLLPMLGVVLLWMGLRSLRRENDGFRFACRCATLYAVLYLTATALRATPLDVWLAEVIDLEWHTTAGSIPLHHALRAVALHIPLTLTVGGLWQGLRGVFVRAGQPPRTTAAWLLTALEAMMLPMALIGLQVWLQAGPMLVMWVLLVVELWKTGKSLDEAGYALTPAPVRFSGSFSLGLWLGIPLAVAVILSVTFSRLPTPSQTLDPSAFAEIMPLRWKLLELGLPEDILSRLTDEQVNLFQGAYGLSVEDCSPYTGKVEGFPQVLVVEVPVRDERYSFRNIYLAYLQWDEDTLSRSYMEGIRIEPDWSTWTMRSAILDGVLEWQDSTGQRQVASLSFRVDTDGGWPISHIADFSLPRNASGPVEGVVIWELVPSFPTKRINFNYQLVLTHRLTPWVYPYRLPSDIPVYSNIMGWDTWDWLYQGYLAPEGKYTPNTERLPPD